MLKLLSKVNMKLYVLIEYYYIIYFFSFVGCANDAIAIASAKKAHNRLEFFFILLMKVWVA